MSDTIEYTESFDVDSSLVEGVYYDARTKSVVIDLNDRLYKYDEVPRQALVDLTTAPSVGAAFVGFKGTYGPSVFVGLWDDVDFEWVPDYVATSDGPAELPTEPQATQAGSLVQNDWNAVPVTKEVSLQPVDLGEELADEPEEEPTKEVSLQTPAASATRGDKDYEVWFELDEESPTRRHVVKNVNSLAEAVAEVEGYIDLFGVDAQIVEASRLG